MRLPHLPETLLAHLSVALVILVASSALGSAQLGATSPAPPSRTTEVPAEAVEGPVVLSDVPDLPRGQGGTIASSRGSRPWRGPSPTATSSDEVSTTPPAAWSTATRPAAAPTATPAAVPGVGPSPSAVPAPAGTPILASPALAQAANAFPPSPLLAPLPETSSASQLRVGLQAGHWKNSELPAELAGLRGSTGAAGSGWKEMEVNLEVASRATRILKEAGVQVDLLPATVPVAYKADAFVSIHGDANSNPNVSGYKLARARWSKIPQKDDALIRAISAQYQAATGLKDHPGTITENMRQYYAFDWRSFKHAVDPTTPSVILELGFLTTAADRKLLLEQPDRAAEGVARGILEFLGR